jgi:hypothetical protein
MKKRLLSILLTAAILLSAMTMMPITASSNVPNMPHRCGDVDGNGVINIMDALEILKFLARLESNILVTFAGTGFTVVDEQGFNSARLMSVRVKGEAPQIFDVLEILKDLASIDGVFSGSNGYNAICYCSWCCHCGDCDCPHCECECCNGNGTTTVATVSVTPTIIAPEFTTVTLMGGRVGDSYSQTILTNSTGLTWTIVGGALSDGLTMNNGVISGTPTAAAVGTATFTVRIENQNGHAEREFSINIVSADSTTEATTTTVTTTTEATTTVTTTTVTTTTNTGPTVTTTTGTTTTREPGVTTERPPAADLRFSHPPGLYLPHSRPFNVRIEAPEGAEIWYTFSSFSGAADANVVSGARWAHNILNRHEGGVVPTNSAPSIRYNDADGIDVTLPRDRTAFTISAVMVLNGVVSQPVTASYIGASEAVAEMWASNDFMVFSLYSDARGIFDRDNGVFGVGLDRDEWLTEYIRLNPGRTRAQYNEAINGYRDQGAYPPTLPANFTRRGRAAEVMTNVEIFDPYRNNQRVNQRAGIRVKGGWSRGTFVNEQKTFEFYARESYGDRDNFLFPLFGERNSLDGNLMHRYERFRIRNGGTDREQTYLRDEMAYELAEMSGKLDTYDSRPAVVFINGAYYGLVWMRTPRTENHWRRHYMGGARENGFEQIGSNEMGRAPCGRFDCGRVLVGAPASGTLPSSPGIPARPAPAICTPATSNTCTRPECRTGAGGYRSNFNDHCRTLGYCRGTHRNFNGTLASDPLAGSGSWEELVRLAIGAPMTGSMSSSEFAPFMASANGLTNAANWERFQEIVCIENLVHYYALNIFGANVDWPSNNTEMWRYYLNDREREEIAAGTSTLHPHLQDEKWRFITHDMEYGYGLWQVSTLLPSATHPNDNTLWALMNRPGGVVRSELGGRSHFNATASASFMIPSITKRDDMRAKLANALSDLLEASHSSENARRVHTRMTNQIRAEHSIALAGAGANSTRRISELARNGQQHEGPGWPTADAIYGSSTSEGTGGIVHFLTNRGSATTGIPSHVQSILGLSWGSRYNVSLTVGAQGGHVIMNTRPVGVHGVAENDPRASRTATGRYFTGVTVPITPQPWPGWRVANVTGATRVGTTNVWTVSAAATVNVTFERDPTADPREIVEIDFRNEDQFIVIRNNSGAAVNMDGYFLTDDGTSGTPENLNKWAFPAGVSIPANGTIRVGMRDNPTTTGWAATTTFRFDFGERLRLVRGAEPNANIVQLVEISRPERSQTQVRGPDGKWRIEGPRSERVPPHNGRLINPRPCSECGFIGEACICGPQPTPGITAQIINDQGHAIEVRITNNSDRELGTHDNPWQAVINIPDGRVAQNNAWGGLQPVVISGGGTNQLLVGSVEGNQHHQPGRLAPGASGTIMVSVRNED